MQHDLELGLEAKEEKKNKKTLVSLPLAQKTKREKKTRQE
jgi:hypothetical protein